MQKYKEFGDEINLAHRRNMKCFHLDSKTDIDCDDAEITDRIVFSCRLIFQSLMHCSRLLVTVDSRRLIKVINLPKYLGICYNRFNKRVGHQLEKSSHEKLTLMFLKFGIVFVAPPFLVLMIM